jgi:hypothetical protein
MKNQTVIEKNTRKKKEKKAQKRDWRWNNLEKLKKEYTKNKDLINSKKEIYSKYIWKLFNIINKYCNRMACQRLVANNKFFF